MLCWEQRSVHGRGREVDAPGSDLHKNKRPPNRWLHVWMCVATADAHRVATVYNCRRDQRPMDSALGIFTAGYFDITMSKKNRVLRSWSWMDIAAHPHVHVQHNSSLYLSSPRAPESRTVTRRVTPRAAPIRGPDELTDTSCRTQSFACFLCAACFRQRKRG